MKVVIEKDESVFIVTIIDDEDCYDLIRTKDHDELLSLLIETLGINYP